MGTILALLLYISYTLFLGRVVWRFFLFARIPLRLNTAGKRSIRESLLTCAKTLSDILFLSRLLRSNPCLWWGEWLFHATFVFSLFRHLRYVIQPAPPWFASYQTFGICSGYVLAGSIMFILFYRLFAKSSEYISGYNYFILSLMSIIGLTGILMKTILRLDVTSVKYFMLGALSFHPVPAPESVTFTIHFITSMILLIFIPSHIFTAPYSLIEARKREETLRLVMHEK